MHVVQLGGVPGGTVISAGASLPTIEVDLHRHSRLAIWTQKSGVGTLQADIVWKNDGGETLSTEASVLTTGSYETDPVKGTKASITFKESTSGQPVTVESATILGIE